MPVGPLLGGEEFERMVWDEWHTFDGSRKMDGYKLLHRMENPVWQPPVLSFSIERHGGTVNGSTRAEVQNWELNVLRRTADIVSTRRRQLHAMAKRVDVKPIAQKVAKDILGERESKKFKRFPDGHIKIKISEVIPNDGFSQTIRGRRRRFREALRTLLVEQGWKEDECCDNTFWPPITSPDHAQSPFLSDTDTKD